MSRVVPIGKAARESGVKVPTIRYYEQIGLLTAPLRSQSNRRLFDDRDLRRLAIIRHARELGFEIDSIRTLIVLQDDPDQSCAAAVVIARARLADVEHRIASLTAQKAELERMIVGCKGDRIDQCRIIEVLADHSQCQSARHR